MAKYEGRKGHKGRKEGALANSGRVLMMGTGEGNAFPYGARVVDRAGGSGLMMDVGFHELRSLMPRGEKARRKLKIFGASE